MFKNWLKKKPLLLARDQASGFSQKTVNSADDSLFVYIPYFWRAPGML